MTRNRLDEICEEEMSRFGREPIFSNREMTRCIAERAFRHGVEQEMIMRIAPNVFSPCVVEPAPAEPSPQDEGSPQAKEKIAAHVCFYGCHCHRDRRHGQRRKGERDRRKGVSSCDSPGCCTDSRRSGNERRKP